MIINTIKITIGHIWLGEWGGRFTLDQKPSIMKFLLTILFVASYLFLNGQPILPADINNANKTKAEYIEFNRILAETYSPVFVHEVNGQNTFPGNYDSLGIRDLITAFDFDGDWVMHNNWDNLWDIVKYYFNHLYLSGLLDEEAKKLRRKVINLLMKE